MMSVLTDLRFALRSARTDWRFTVTLTATLALGIAASAAIFNLVNATLLRPLPIADESRVYRLQDYSLDAGGERVLRSNRVLNYLSIVDEARAFESIVAMRRVEWSLIGSGSPIPVNVILVSPRSLELTGGRLQAGRLFTREEEDAGLDANVVIISHSLWQRQFSGRPEVLGTTVRFEERVVTIVGVLAPGFRFPYDAEAWMPERVDPALDASLAVFARLGPDVSRSHAEAELDAIAARAEAARPVVNRGVRFAMTPVRESLVGDDSRATLALMAAAVLLLALACANVANLQLGRGIRRAREIALRTALGAGRYRQVRQMLVESVTFAALGGVAGLLIAAPLSESMVGMVPNELRDQLGLLETTIDWRAAFFAAAVTGLVGILAGLAPALKLTRTGSFDALRHSARTVTGGHGLMRVLVIGEVALAAVLLVTAGLMVDNFSRLLQADLGLQSDRLLSLRVPVPPRYDTAERRRVLVQQLTEAARSLPGTERAGVVTVNPIDRGSYGAAIEAESHPIAPGQSPPIVNHRLVTHEWLRTAGVALLRGRHFTAADTAASPMVAIVSRRLAERMWPGVDAIGQRVRQARGQAPWITVVGVAGDVRDTGEWEETWYVPFDQHAGTAAASILHVMLRTPVDAGAALAAMRGAVASVDPLLPIPEPTVMRTMWEEAQTPQRMGAIASALFAITGLLLAGLGTYGVLAYHVSARMREFGIRQALGATSLEVNRLIMRDAGLLIAGGLSLGAVLSVAAVRSLRSVTTEVLQVPASLPWIVAGVVILSALVAAIVPARRATRISPVEVMRSE